jgi:hypothetical protein
MQFPKDDLLRLLEDDIPDNYAKISERVTGTGRWSIRYELIFRHNNQFFRTNYSVGATESQDESPYEYEGDMIDVTEVFAKEKTITVYEIN